MRLAFIGNFMHPWCSEVHWKLTLEALGHDVVPLQEGPPTWPHAITAEKVLAAVAESRADALVWVRTWRMAGDCMGMLEELSRRGVPTISYHLDLYATIPRGTSDGHEGHGVTDDPWWRCKYVFSPDGGSDPFWKKHGINHIYMPPAVYHGECYQGVPRDALKHDVVFVGQYHYHEEWPHRKQLVNWMRYTYGSRCGLYPIPGSGPIRGDDLNALYASAKIAIGDTLLMPGHSHYTSDRLFETLGRGGFLIYPRIPGVTDGTLVTEGEHVACYDYGDFDGLGKRIAYYLEHEDEREAIRLAGHEHVKTHHTYMDRWRAALAHVSTAEGWS